MRNTGREIEIEVRDVGEAIVAAMAHGGVDHLFFSSGTELAFYQEAIAKARCGAAGAAPHHVTHEYVEPQRGARLCGRLRQGGGDAAHVDVGTQHHGGALHTAWRSGLPVMMTAGAPATAGRASPARATRRALLGATVVRPERDRAAVHQMGQSPRSPG